MKKFKIFNDNGIEGHIILGDLFETGCFVKINVIEVKFKNNTVKENQIAGFAKNSGTSKLCLQFKDNTLLKINNQELIEYVNKLNKVDKKYKDSYVYSYTREAKQNFSL